MTETWGNRPFRVGVVGAGSVAALHLDAAAGLPEVEVAAVCDVRLPAAEQLAAGFGARAYADHTAMFAAGGLDGVLVTAPHSLHAPITVDAAAAGLHVLVEKPMATTLEDGQRMIDACATHGVRLAVGHVLHFLPTVREAWRILRSGSLGRPVVITERRTARYERGSRPDWFFDPVLAGGGILMNVGTHSIDKAQWLGDAPATSVHGYVWNRPGAEVETESVGLLELANGVRVVLSVTGTGLPFRDETEVVCEHGALRLSRSDGLWTYRGDDAVQVVTPEQDDIVVAFREQLADFVASCRDGRTPAVDAAYGQSVVATALALYESAQRVDPVRIPRFTVEAAA
ncbi:Gfo/Idh/MocA family oxidoreductase [Micromonospora sp. DR5-3]|uniref:Gfo/Idh/MocA family protein n=1 Tax=unclassified Micromonospora TaxID=2617518 RepID=UPI0011D422F4|nr:MULTISPECIES: Gfo/Idh/MocA family oxidoreductase [unclassified Micromonospora]MCW3814372.1 Gfo/Idh/MocA family oxidoreductase [Micromonospora sp. DR5-3]TYC22438.1 Gfo/Idh/MocA family oxidoreductase [Micromonospora sp. MP36]